MAQNSGHNYKSVIYGSMQVYGVGPWFNSGEEIPLVAAVDRVVVVVAVVLVLSPIGGGQNPGIEINDVDQSLHHSENKLKNFTQKIVQRKVLKIFSDKKVSELFFFYLYLSLLFSTA